ncbi:hypothetical protein TNCV_3564631 [Trichonephila clavipes]|nr:hypothetical protein TNCV_3564631 [Trichonephila clavipes]
MILRDRYLAGDHCKFFKEGPLPKPSAHSRLFCVTSDAACSKEDEKLMKKRKCGTAPEVRRPGALEGRRLIWLLHLQALAEQKWSGLQALGGPTGSRYSRRTSPTPLRYTPSPL